MGQKLSKAERQAMIIMITYFAMVIGGVAAVVIWLHFFH